MEILHSHTADVARAVELLKKGSVIAYPTDTAYGLGGLFDSRTVKNKILRIKQRTDEKFVLIASSLYQVQRFFRLQPLEKHLAKKYWPGPLSIIVSDRYSVRVPDNMIARTLARRAGKPLIATSANISGQPAAYDFMTAFDYFKDQKYQPAAIIDAGRLKKKQPSTIVRVQGKSIEIVRSGAIKITD